ncbi:MAG: GGDEF domain-containing protein, partial [Clostridium sp.]|nr:GGDEF domain-containing protein [Clostridium sp.]
LCFVAVRVVTWYEKPLYTGFIPAEMPSFFYLFNTMITFVMLLTFSILFSLEIRYMQRQLEQENHTLGQMANYDPLTHLSNRRSMNNHLKSAVEQGELFCLVMADIDNFKKVNDTYGHECGDEILIRVSDIISGNIREQDHVCRWGGEEMLLLLKADLDNSRKVAERICKEVADSVVKYKDTDVRVTLTLGIAEYELGETIRSAIGRADKNLYYGKNNGKNQVVC